MTAVGHISLAEDLARAITMRVEIAGKMLELVQGDITSQEVDCVVNAANSQLAGGGGVDGAIHRKAGSSVMEETSQKYPDGCPTGSAVISSAGNLSAKHIVHAVGPFWNGGRRGEAEHLAGAYRRSLELAVEHDCHSIALPALSTGAYRYPMDLAAEVALTTAIECLRKDKTPQLVRFVLFNEKAYRSFAEVLDRLS